jgi:putative ABC transport system permease protein
MTGWNQGAGIRALAGDFKYALRRMLRAPGFTAVAVASLALGIGANTAIFSLVNAVLLTGKPYQNPEELVEIYTTADGIPYGVFSYPDFRDLREATTEVFAGISAAEFAFVQTDVVGGVKVITAELVSGNFFEVSGVRPHLGRLFTGTDDVAPGAHWVAVLGYGYWESMFGADPGVVGTDIRLNGRLYEVIGVTQPEYQGDMRVLTPDLYAPMMMANELNPSSTDQFEARDSHSIFVRARLNEGVGLPRVEAALERTASDLRAEYPGSWTPDESFLLIPTEDVIIFPAVDKVLVPALSVLMGVVGLVLLIACANLASFLLARATDRRKEIAIRLALGARRSILVRQLMAETTLLGLLGGGAGVLLANLGLNALLTADLPLPLPITLDLAPDGTVLLFTLGVSILAGILFGLAPALQATNPDVAPTLKDEGTGGGRPKKLTLRNALVAGQVAASLVLLVGAGLFLRSLRASQSIDPGFGMEPAAILTIDTPLTRYESRAEAQLFTEALMETIGTLPGVTAVGSIDRMQLDPLNSQEFGFNIDGIDPPPGRMGQSVARASITPGLFEAVGMELLRGRDFSELDRADGVPVAIVNQTFVDRFWPEGNGVGEMLRSGDREIQIVGVVRDSKVGSLSEGPTAQIFLPVGQRFSSSWNIIARTTGEPTRLLRSMFEAGRALDPELMVFQMKTMERLLDVRLLPARLSAVLSIAFGVLAATLACLGLYGVVSFAVASKTREVGIRMSLGADRSSVVSLMLRQGLGMVVVGGILGLIMAGLLAGVLSQFLFGVDPLDPIAFTAAPGLLVFVSILAAWIPARRASRIDPVRALRAD